jgi:hypothetical protein
MASYGRLLSGLICPNKNRTPRRFLALRQIRDALVRRIVSVLLAPTDDR